MPNENAQRRLISILAADVVEYSRMMEADEAGTMAALKSRRDEILKPLVAKHHGRVFKLLGDGVLVEFFSAVNAVQCAIELQGAFATANADVAENQRILLRIGINLGDVMVEGGDLYGDGVNVASRLENLAEPGGIVISGPVHDFIKNKVNCQFADLGAQSLKNISTPVQAYKISGTPLGPVPAQPVHGAKPSIAVLAFVNMSGDPDQDYFADGLAEDIITALSRFSNLTVFQLEARAGRGIGRRNVP